MDAGSLARPRKPDLRRIIDRCDKQILSALGQRMQAARRIGKLKVSQAAPVHDPDREKRMMRQRSEWGESLGLPQEFIDELFDVILKHSTRAQSSNR
jgi:chorismate mutase